MEQRQGTYVPHVFTRHALFTEGKNLPHKNLKMEEKTVFAQTLNKSLNSPVSHVHFL